MRLRWPIHPEASRPSCASSCLRSDVVPALESYTYVTTTGTLREKKRPAAQVAQLYRLVVSQITLLYMRDLFEADPELDNVELGGHVHP